MDQNLPLTPVDTSNTRIETSPGRTIRKIVLLNILTFGFYSFRLFYLNWKEFRGRAWQQEISPGWRTFGLFVPIVGIVLLYRQFRDIQAHIEERVAIERIAPLLLAIGWYSQVWIDRAGSKYFESAEPLPTFASLAVSTGVIVLFQQKLNAYWQHEMPDLPLQSRFSTWEKVFATLGSFIWVLFLWGCLMPE